MALLRITGGQVALVHAQDGGLGRAVVSWNSGGHR